MNLQDLFNLAARKGKASTIFVPQQQQPSFLKTAAQQPQQASTIFIPQQQMPSFLETAAAAGGVSPLFKFPNATTKSEPKTKPTTLVTAPATIPAGTVQPGAIVSGLTPAGEVDRSQSDEYKSQLAQYRNLIGQKKEQEAEDLGMKIWMEKYGGKLGLTGPNPLMEGFGGFVPTQGPTPAVLQASDAPLKAFGQEVKTYFPGAGPEGFSPLDAQDQQQQATADQADMATTVKLPVRNRVQAFLQGGM